MTPNILFIGTGITSALSASFIQKIVPSSNIFLWDKARGVGGRMSRSISQSDNSCSADLGAQYITTDKKTMSKWDDVYGPLIREGLIEEMTANAEGMRNYKDDVRHFIAPQGMNSLVKYFLRDLPEENIRFQSKVITIDDDDKGNFIVKSEEDSHSANVVISTIPVPQFLQLSGSVKTFVEKYKKELEGIKYSSRFVLIFYYEKHVKFPELDWALKYLDHQIFRYVSIDNRKRNRPDDPVAVIFHTSVPFGLENLEQPIADMEKVLMKQAKELFPDWPEPTSTRCHKWRYSQVVEPFPGSPGYLLLNKNPTLILGGDAFSVSNFDGCIYSAKKIVQAIHHNLS